MMSGEPKVDALIGQIAEQGYAIVPGFLEASIAAALLEESRERRGRGELRAASVGRGEGRQVHAEIRSDHIHWIDPAQPSEAERAYLDIMEGLRLELNRAFYLGLFDFEAHLACYPPGAGYRAHLDCHRDSDARQVSAILYLNHDWRVEDGGLLRLYTDRETGVKGPFIDVMPAFGTLAIFLSADYWHEVLPAHRERYSVTGWFRKRPT